ncbi:MAG TPA: sucrase/ferredoxin-like family protein [Actinomycetota bacterium]|nr:sucrase/ferredoxin-like family protein [Actinomycetota bacterium]
MTESLPLSPAGEPRQPLAGTVKRYDRHVFVCTGRVGWPGHIDQDGGFIQDLHEAGAGVEGLKINACDEPSKADGTDLLLFPEGVRYLGVTVDQFSLLVEELSGTGISRALSHEALLGHHVFVCVHANRDVRCGKCGPPVARRFREEVQARGLSGQVAVRRTSHVGGHDRAGNVLIYPGGDWYGYVTPDEVPRIVEAHLQGGQIVADLWRGRIGMGEDDQVALASSWGAG